VSAHPSSNTAPHSRRLRELAREGFLLLLAPEADPAAAVSAAERLSAPVRTVELAAIDSTGALGEALAVRPGEVWVVRPDAHVAAVLDHPTGTTIEKALLRALAATSHEEEGSEHGVLPTIR
jgi:pentachlorophenol monooxygenase/3-(3-hydroxy-phenyl)propionate hydroxylase